MTETKLTLGKAIDQIVEALSSFDDKDRKAILGTVCSHLQIELAGQSVPAASHRATPERGELGTHSPAATPTIRAVDQGIDIRRLKDQKKPNSARQMACLVAYYLQEHAPANERKDVITIADVEKYFKQAGYKLPEKLEQLLIDCKRSGYFESSKRGEYTLTRVGYNLVTHSMPGKEKA